MTFRTCRRSRRERVRDRGALDDRRQEFGRDVRKTRKYRVRHGHADVEVRRAPLVDHGLARCDVEALLRSHELDLVVHRPRREPDVVRALQLILRETPERVWIADLRTTASRARGDGGLLSQTGNNGRAAPPRTSSSVTGWSGVLREAATTAAPSHPPWIPSWIFCVKDA